MNLPIDEKELEYIVMALWKCRKTETQCNDLYEKLKEFHERSKQT